MSFAASAARIYSCQCCCCEPVLYLYIEGREDALDSPSTLGIWVPWPLSLGCERAARAEAAHAGRCWGGSTLAFALRGGAPASHIRRQQCCGMHVL